MTFGTTGNYLNNWKTEELARGYPEGCHKLDGILVVTVETGACPMVLGFDNPRDQLAFWKSVLASRAEASAFGQNQAEQAKLRDLASRMP